MDKLGIGTVVLLAQYFFEEKKTPLSKFQKYWCKCSFVVRLGPDDGATDLCAHMPVSQDLQAIDTLLYV